MTEESPNDYTVPTDPEIRRQIRECVSEASAQMQMIDDRKSMIKDIVTRAKDDLGVPKRIFSKMVKTFHKQEFAAVTADNEVFQMFYENIMEQA